MRTVHDIWRCEICNHKWLAFTKEPPSQCAKCRKRGWHSGVDRTEDVQPPKKQEVYKGKQATVPNAGNPEPIEEALLPQEEISEQEYDPNFDMGA